MKLAAASLSPPAGLEPFETRPGAVAAGATTEATPVRANGISSRVVVLLLALALLPYLNALHSGFTFDDRPDIVENPVVSGPLDPVRILATPLPPGDLYRPFTVLTFALDQRLTPGNPVVFHLTNLLLHAAVTLLVFFLALRLFESVQTAVIAAALFAVHPVHTEAVTNVVGRAELLAALFGLLALLTAVAADGAPAARRRRLEFTSLAAFALALLSKESAATVVPLIVLLRVAVRGEPLIGGLRRELARLDWLPYVLCITAFAVVRFLVVRAIAIDTLSPLDNVLGFVPWIVRVRSALGVLWDYFGLLLVPLMLGADYSYGQVPLARTWGDPRFLAGLGLIALAMVVLARNRRPAVTVAALFPFVAISLTANVLFPIGTVKAERLLYFPSVGWVLLLGYGFSRLLEHPRYRHWGAATLLLVMTAYAGRTWLRNWDWLNDMTLYRSMVESSPNSAKALYDSAITLQGKGQDVLAAAEFHRALKIFPWGGGEGSPWGLGIIAEKRGQFAAAAAWYRKALDLNPAFDKAHIGLCEVLLAAHRYAEANGACRAGLRYRPADAGLLKGLGLSFVGQGQKAKGITVLQRALKLRPEDIQLRAYLGRLRSQRGTPAGGERNG
jgi:protein O-mannosyl-transferase